MDFRVSRLDIRVGLRVAEREDVFFDGVDAVDSLGILALTP
jgi:hypothetical protein